MTSSFDDTSAEEFTRKLKEFRDKVRIANAEIGRRTGIDEAYLSRLFSGERTRPSRDVVIRLAAFGLGLDQYDSDELLMSAEYRPLLVA